ncbi:hypothetical protein NMM18_09630 [Streptococcus oralis]|uniref:Uncharacterized protein n=2 Tax=Streptococcus TaxID=1301 RepID=A0A1L8Q2H6_STROR|nr:MULTISPECIES: hypothetical protein [Streptococcus]AQA07706.1 putative membrane protein [Streptococcus oralis]MBN6012275.1 hypothetical protein [Streptococcus oralis subsp. oralis]MCP9038681.1 hypothetical protein [Streptococcus oralis]MCP9053789.1 hypothetical protein [Streptococcus oralis]MCP9059265.1 hypothetical protein [Streptococcus oralis]
MILERIKKTFEFQRSKIKGPVPLWGVLNGIFILYPIAFFMFMAGGLEVLKNEDLYQGLLIAGIVVWILNLVFLLDLKRGILTSFGTYLMYLTGHVYTIIGFSSLSGDHNFIVLKLSLPLIYAIIIIIVMSCLVDLDSEEIISEKAGKIMLNYVMGPPLILSTCFILVGVFGYDFLMSWGVSLLLMIFGQFLYASWFVIIYAYQHRHDIEETRPIKHIEVSSDLIQNKEFDKNRFKKETKHD